MFGVWLVGGFSCYMPPFSLIRIRFVWVDGLVDCGDFLGCTVNSVVFFSLLCDLMFSLFCLYDVGMDCCNCYFVCFGFVIVYWFVCVL